MFNQIFVSYLTRQQIITPVQAQEALEVQNNTRIRIGVLAVEENLMTPEQVEEVNNLQASKNARFGDIAVDKGYLTKEQVELLLTKQPREHVVLKQIVCDRQYMDAGQFDAALADFKSELGVDGGQFEKLQDNDTEAYLDCIAGIDSGNLLMRAYAKMFISATIRFVGREIFIKKAVKADFSTSRFLVTQNAVGDASVRFIFASEDSDSATTFAEKFAKGTFEMLDMLDEEAVDSLKEFLNCVNGLMIAELSDTGKMELDIEVPEYHDKLAVEPDTLILPFSLLHIGEFYIFIRTN